MDIALSSVHRGLLVSFHVINTVHRTLQQAGFNEDVHKQLVKLACQSAALQALDTNESKAGKTTENGAVANPIAAPFGDNFAQVTKDLEQRLKSHRRQRNANPAEDTHPVYGNQRISVPEIVELLRTAWNGAEKEHINKAHLNQYFQGVAFLYRTAVKHPLTKVAKALKKNGELDLSFCEYFVEALTEHEEFTSSISERAIQSSSRLEKAEWTLCTTVSSSTVKNWDVPSVNFNFQTISAAGKRSCTAVDMSIENFRRFHAELRSAAEKAGMV